MQDFLRAIEALTEHLHTLSRNDPELRARLHAVGEQWTALFAPPTAEPSITTTATTKPSATTQTPVVDEKKLATLKAIGIGGQRTLTPPKPTPAPAAAPDHETLELIRTRCQLKADAAHWRAACLRQPPPVETGRYRPNGERELIERAQPLQDCFLWMLQADAGPTEPALYTDLGGCFELCAQIASLLSQMNDDTAGNGNRPQREQDVLFQAAAAQSALCAAVLRVGNNNDRDQLALFNWLRSYAEQHSIYIPRHMRRDDLADPTQWSTLQTQLVTLGGTTLPASQRDRPLRRGLNTIRYHLKQRRQDAFPEKHHWQRIFKTVDEIIEQGFAPSHVELRELLLPVLDDIPDDLDISEPSQQVLKEIDRYLATRPESPVADEASAPNADIQAIARLLKGRRIVLIGGDRRPYAEAALIRAFDLDQVYWQETRPHQSYMEFESYVARAEVALVLLAIRWSSHGFADVNAFCQRYDKPLVRLPGGYNPAQVAQQIDQQVRLELERRYGPTSETGST